jgi:hypothetical protein
LLIHVLTQHAFSQRSVPEIRVVVTLGEGIEVDDRRALRELEPSEQVDVLPGDRGDALEDLDRRGVSGGLLLRVDPRQQRSVVVDGVSSRNG